VRLPVPRGVRNPSNEQGSKRTLARTNALPQFRSSSRASRPRSHRHRHLAGHLRIRPPGSHRTTFRRSLPPPLRSPHMSVTHECRTKRYPCLRLNTLGSTGCRMEAHRYSSSPRSWIRGSPAKRAQGRRVDAERDAEPKPGPGHPEATDAFPGPRFFPQQPLRWTCAPPARTSPSSWRVPEVGGLRAAGPSRALRFPSRPDLIRRCECATGGGVVGTLAASVARFRRVVVSPRPARRSRARTSLLPPSR
jgi:hypothetical protein